MVEDNQAEKDQITTTKAKEASALAIAAGQAYLDGDMPTAVRLYKEAGDILAEVVAIQPKPSQRDFVRLLAASHYYKGGHYVKALRQVERMKPQRLEPEFKATYSKFALELQERTHKNYGKKIAGQIKKLSSARKYEEILMLLNEHPYALPPLDTVRLRFSFANLAGLLSPEEIASQAGIDMTPVSEEGRDALDVRFKPPEGMRRSVATGNLEPDPDYIPYEEETDTIKKVLFDRAKSE